MKPQIRAFTVCQGSTGNVPRIIAEFYDNGATNTAQLVNGESPDSMYQLDIVDSDEAIDKAVCSGSSTSLD